MNARVSRYTPVQSASANPLRDLVARATPASRPMASRTPTAAEIDALCEITPAKLRRLSNSRVSADNLATYAAALERHRRGGEINTLLRVTHFLSQLAHECTRYSRMVESFAYSPTSANNTFSRIQSEAHATELLAADRTGEAFANHVYATSNGNNQAGDGYRFRGRGFIQLTGRANYKSMSDKLVNLSIDLVSDPDRAAEADTAARIAVGYWTDRKINAAADRDDVSAVTRLINGPALKGLEDRRQLLAVAKAAFYPKP